MRLFWSWPFLLTPWLPALTGNLQSQYWALQFTMCLLCLLWHGENSPAWPAAPGFYAPLHKFPPPTSAVGCCCTSLDTITASNVFWCNFSYIYTCPKNSIQLSGKAISKIIFYILWNLEEIWHSWHTWVTSKGLRIILLGHLLQLESVGSGVGLSNSLPMDWLQTIGPPLTNMDQLWPQHG